MTQVVFLTFFRPWFLDSVNPCRNDEDRECLRWLLLCCLRINFPFIRLSFVPLLPSLAAGFRPLGMTGRWFYPHPSLLPEGEGVILFSRYFF